MQIIAGTHKKRKILTPKGLKTRPTSGRLREALFNIIQNRIEGALFLDLFAGSGAVGLEAISRGAKEATFVEKERTSIQCIRHNVKTFGMEEQTRIYHGDVLQWVKKLKGKIFDIIFIDAPYGVVQGDVSAHLFHVIHPLLKEGGLLFLEEREHAQLPITQLDPLTFISKRSIGSSQLFQYGK